MKVAVVVLGGLLVTASAYATYQVLGEIHQERIRWWERDGLDR